MDYGNDVYVDIFFSREVVRLLSGIIDGVLSVIVYIGVYEILIRPIVGIFYRLPSIWDIVDIIKEYKM